MTPCRRLLPPIAISLLLLLAGCATLKANYAKHASAAMAPRADTPSARYIDAELARQGGLSGFRLLTRSDNALLSRVMLADHARHSIDLQYYIFRNDATGRLLSERLLAAADRGVRVRLLIDDLNLAGQDRMLAALDAHPSIEVRRFNPFQTRDPSMLSKLGQFLLDARRLNRRMHNKSFIVDGSAAIVGGRNIGDDYFDASVDSNFRDLDLIAIGPVVSEASRVFDAYWNSTAAVPVDAFEPLADSAGDLARLRVALASDAHRFAESDYAQAALDELPDGPSADRRGEWFWGQALLLADDPGKIDGKHSRSRLALGPQLQAMLQAAGSEVLMVSPYFVPGATGTSFLAGLVHRGVRVQVLTNSLSATDEDAVHAKYAAYRRRLLAGGVQLYELRALPGGPKRASVHGASSGVSLHAKAVVVDDRHVFIGSLNLDQRSRLLNTEMGIVVDSAPLASAVRDYFTNAASPANAYELRLAADAGGRRQMVWRWNDGVGVREETHDPGVGIARRLRVRLFALLPIEDLL